MQYNRGLTLVEIIVAVAIFGIVISLSIFFGLDSFRGYLVRADRDTLNSALSRARSRAMNNFFESAHGVCFDQANGSYVIFRGNSYSASDPNNESIAGSGAAIVTSDPSGFLCDPGPGVVFSQISGRATPSDIEIVITENGRVSTTTINHEGTINW